MVHEWAVKMQTCRGFGGMFPRKNLKILNFWIALDYILRVFMLEKERKRM